MKFVLVVIVFLCSLNPVAKEVISVAKTCEQTYTGMIGQKIILMNLSIIDNGVTGVYHYDGFSTLMDLYGSIDNGLLNINVNPMFILQDEINKSEGLISVGHITVSSDQNGNLSGTVRFSSNAPYHIMLKKVFEVNYVDTSLNATFKNQDPSVKEDTVYTLSLSEPQFLDLPYRKKLKYINFWYSYRLISLMNKKITRI
jgi:hypothetical protein